MTQNFTLTPEQRDAFKRAGMLRLDRLLSAEGVRRAREVVLRRLEPLGLWKAGAWHLDALPRPQWPNTGLKTSQVIGNHHPELAALVEESALAAAVDALLEGPLIRAARTQSASTGALHIAERTDVDCSIRLAF